MKIACWRKLKDRWCVLEADLSALLERLSQDGEDGSQRPLLAGGLEASLRLLLENRREHYASFPLRVDASGLSERKWLAKSQRVLGRYHLQAMGSPYDAVVQAGGLDALGEMLAARSIGSTVMLVSDEHVAPLYAQRALRSLRQAGFKTAQFVIPAGEAHKNIETVMAIWGACLRRGPLTAGARSFALGWRVWWGTWRDSARPLSCVAVTGCPFRPACWLWWMPVWEAKPVLTCPRAKIWWARFTRRVWCWADPQVLATLPERELRAGLAEVVKHGVIADPDLYALCAHRLGGCDCQPAGSGPSRNGGEGADHRGRPL